MKNTSPFYVQLHMHTSESSRCGVSDGREMARACKAAGYGLIVITDHFLNANTTCTPDMSWPEKVDRLFAGYRAARAEGEKIGLTVLKGWETFTSGPEYLTYGLDERFLLQHPDICALAPREYLDLIHAAGGYVIHAHPYRQAPYIPYFVPDMENVDACEVLNANHTDPSFDERALRDARAHHKIETAGSDAHHVSQVRGGAMRFDGPISTMDQLIAALRGGKGRIVPLLT